MPNPMTMMKYSQDQANLTGDPVKADGWYGHVDGLHTIVISVVNFTGRIYIEASLSISPRDEDWFPVILDSSLPYLQFPLNPRVPTGEYTSGGDTSTVGFSFRINAIWLRARLDRSYLSTILYQNDPDSLALIGNVQKITLAR